MFFPDTRLVRLLNELQLDSDITAPLIQETCWILSFSGGADSMLTLYLLLLLQQNDRMPRKLILFYLDHLQEFKEMEVEKRRCIFKFAQLEIKKAPNLSLEIIIIKKNIPRLLKNRKLSGSFEYLGSSARRKELRKIKLKHSGAVISGHTLSDWYETLWMRLNRGTSLQKIIPFGFCEKILTERYYRPLFLCFREEVRSICRKHGLDFWEDPTNEDVSFLRNYIRQKERIKNTKGLRKSALNFLDEKRKVAIPNIAYRTVVEYRELHIGLKEFIDLTEAEKLLIYQQAFQYLGLGAFSGKFREQLKKKTFFKPPFYSDQENWNGNIYQVYRRGRQNLWHIQQESKDKIERFLSAKGNAGYETILGDRLTKRHRIEFLYGHKSVKDLFRDKRISERQRQNLFLVLDKKNPYQILFIPLSVFGLTDVQNNCNSSLQMDSPVTKV